MGRFSGGASPARIKFRRVHMEQNNRHVSSSLCLSVLGAVSVVLIVTAHRLIPIILNCVSSSYYLLHVLLLLLLKTFFVKLKPK